MNNPLEPFTLALLLIPAITAGCSQQNAPSAPVLVPGAPTTITISESNFTVRLENIVPVQRLVESNQVQRELNRTARRVSDFDWAPGNIRIELSHRPVVFQTTNGKWALIFPDVKELPCK